MAFVRPLLLQVSAPWRVWDGGTAWQRQRRVPGEHMLAECEIGVRGPQTEVQCARDPCRAPKWRERAGSIAKRAL